MYDSAYIEYLTYFHCDRDYFECHEVLEEHWKKDHPQNRKKYWVGLIQLAVGLYHHRRGNFAGAYKMISNAIVLLEEERQSVQLLGLHSTELLKQLTKRKMEISNRLDYYSFNLPIIDKELLTICQKNCNHSQQVWGESSDLSNEYLINKHTKRNRSGVINERIKQLELRKKTRKL